MNFEGYICEYENYFRIHQTSSYWYKTYLRYPEKSILILYFNREFSGSKYVIKQWFGIVAFTSFIVKWNKIILHIPMPCNNLEEIFCHILFTEWPRLFILLSVTELFPNKLFPKPKLHHHVNILRNFYEFQRVFYAKNILLLLVFLEIRFCFANY